MCNYINLLVVSAAYYSCVSCHAVSYGVWWVSCRSIECHHLALEVELYIEVDVQVAHSKVPLGRFSQP